ncbi:glycoside hydrolase family 6 protein [Amycolatopsis sp. CB00013]|uniref:glycoside hydrolase family 6 protein n=1 Tax=Amycolatopsis sp. CB00013 TaxID=1703945 RepID=UPI0013018F75|nr:glycoside hydrolase family 6 protein [Amycolatopsis sp. CB00013]
MLLLGGCVGLPGRTDPPPEFRLLAGNHQLARDPESPAAVWTHANVGSKIAAFGPIERTIAYTPVAHRFTADEADLTGHVHEYVAHAAKQNWMPMLIAAFTAPGTCPTVTAPTFDGLAKGLGTNKAIVVLEPRLLGGACTDSELVTRYLTGAVDRLRADAPNAFVFLDASVGGRSDEQAARLVAAGVARAAGVTVNVGGYTGIGELEPATRKLFDALSAATGRTDYFLLADSSRNGAAVGGSCNPIGAKIGTASMFSDQPGALQQAWLTVPGLSDGPCGAAPTSRTGEFVPDLALQMTG